LPALNQIHHEARKKDQIRQWWMVMDPDGKVVLIAS